LSYELIRYSFRGKITDKNSAFPILGVKVDIAMMNPDTVGLGYSEQNEI
jgi:hypothetical protein